LGGPDVLVYILPVLKPLLIYKPTMQHLTNSVKLPQCLVPPLSRYDFQKELDHFAAQPSGAWTTVSVPGSDGGDLLPKVADQRGSQSILLVPSIKDYLRMLSMHNAQMSTIDSTQHTFARAKAAPGIEANAKLAQSVLFPRQDYCTARAYIPEWYETFQKETGQEKSQVSAQSTITSIASLGAVYGISIMGPVEGTTESIIGAAAEEGVLQKTFKENPPVAEEAKLVEAAFKGQWSAESLLDPDVVDATLLVSKLKALSVPQLPPKLGEQFVSQSKPPVKNTGRVAPKDAGSSEWRPRINSLIATSSTITGHKAPVVRLAVSVDSSFFVSGSHDGTCGIWETSQLDDCAGILDSSIIYLGHNETREARINDVAMVEGTHSVVSGDSNGSVHVWRVDMIQSNSTQSANQAARAVGSSEVRQTHGKEGEILSVTHYTGLSSSVLLYATQFGTIHSWDLRCAQEPFALRHSPGLGHLTTMALGNDRQWLVSGTNKGYVALWDVRFQNTVKLWRHTSGEKIHRVATSFVPPPQYWSGRFANTDPRPFAFLGTGANECGMFDLIDGSCKECFRTVWTDSKKHNEGLPSLLDVNIGSRSGSNALIPKGPQFQSRIVSSYPAITCMVGSVGGQNQSFLMTGGSDRCIRFWDFATPSRCYAIAGEPSNAPRSSYERIDVDGPRRLMLCHQPPFRALRGGETTGKFVYKGLQKPENHHSDSIMDLKIIDNGLVSCSRDCTLKVWR
jgi:phosphoinositide-3-kinase regulatory subunit 4